MYIYKKRFLFIITVLLLPIIMGGISGCSTKVFNSGIFNGHNYEPMISRPGREPGLCYGRKVQLPECDRPLKIEKLLDGSPEKALTMQATQRLSWYIAQAPADTATSWTMDGIIYSLYLDGPIVIPSPKHQSCRDVRVFVKPFKSTMSWQELPKPFCFNSNYSVWLPKGVDESILKQK